MEITKHKNQLPPKFTSWWVLYSYIKKVKPELLNPDAQPQVKFNLSQYVNYTQKQTVAHEEWIIDIDFLKCKAFDEIEDMVYDFQTLRFIESLVISNPLTAAFINNDRLGAITQKAFAFDSELRGHNV